ncbi:hypothetical protein Vadar_026747 [Vaccinium darrowii]|uniref:Uncharacterized protein n=1 Tax=Vaccinium darrowii TaxID=229202 RepID=A0ACB7YPR0_9ERIC|nr:hypothetical protein Vadar_026747 [Vaccinium darrowii]
MPKLAAPSVLLLLLFITATATAIAPKTAPNPSAHGAVDTSPAPSPTDNEQFLKSCVSKFTDKCGPQVFGGVFMHVTVTEPCCKNLVNVGKQCHDGLVRRIYDEEVRRAREGNGEVVVDEERGSRILSRSEKVWNDCVRLGVAPGRVPPSRVRWLP